MIFRPKSEQQPLPGIKPIKKQERKERRGEGRKAIIVLFIVTVLASVLFYLQAEAPKIWEKITAPKVISRLPKGHFNPDQTIVQLKELTQDLSGTYGIYVYRFKDGDDYGLNQEKVFPAASLNKLPIMIAAYQQAEEGKINLETKYTLKEGDKVQGAGLLQSEPVGSQYTYRQLIEFMAQSSDNTAFKIMRQVTQEKLVEKMTLKEVGLLFKQLYEGELINQENTEELFQFLTETDFEDRLPQGVPGDIRVSHKIGSLTGVYNDAGIIFAEPPFVLVIMTEDARESEALEVLPQITRIVWDFETAL